MSTLRGWAALLFVGALGCGSSGSDGTGSARHDGGGTGGASGVGGASGAGGDPGTGGEAGTGGSAGAGGAGAGGSAGAGGAGAGGAGAGGAGGSAGGLPAPSAASLPTPTGPCPDFAAGRMTFSPNGVKRDVNVWMTGAAATLHGPLIFYWHGTGSDPVLEPAYALGAQMSAITAAGGIVIAPYHDPAAGAYPWFLTSGGTNEADLRVADEALACAIQKVGIDTRRIHSMGMSAGGLNTSQMSWRRSGYVASVVVYSGGLIGAPPPDEDPTNKFAAMLFYGGASDVVVISFAQAQQAYHDALASQGRFSFLCNHNKGHSVPTDAAASVWKFFQDHPWATAPEPYKGGLPAGFPTYCTL